MHRIAAIRVDSHKRTQKVVPPRALGLRYIGIPNLDRGVIDDLQIAIYGRIIGDSQAPAAANVNLRIGSLAAVVEPHVYVQGAITLAVVHLYVLLVIRLDDIEVAKQIGTPFTIEILVLDVDVSNRR